MPSLLVIYVPVKCLADTLSLKKNNVTDSDNKILPDSLEMLNVSVYKRTITICKKILLWIAALSQQST